MGERVAAAILAARADDGAALTAPWPDSMFPANGGRLCRSAASFGPRCCRCGAKVEPFALDRGDRFRPPAPPAPHTRRYAAEVNFTRQIGGLDERFEEHGPNRNRAVLGLRSG